MKVVLKENEGLSVGDGGSNLSGLTVAEGSGCVAGIKAFKYTNAAESSVTDTLTFSADINEFSAFAENDWVSVVNVNKYANAAQIDSIGYSGNNTIMYFKSNLPFSTISADDGFDARCVYVSEKPYVGNIELGLWAHAEGFRSSAVNAAAHAEGRDTKAYGEYSHAEGRGTEAQYAAHAEGLEAIARGNYSHAEGYKASAFGAYSHVEGDETYASGSSSHTEGYNTSAYGNSSHTEGQNSMASGTGAHAEGSNTKARTFASHAEGDTTSTSGNASHAEGYKTYALEAYAHTEGTLTSAYAAASHVEGAGGQASGYISHAEGSYTITKNKAEHAEGQCNKSHRKDGVAYDYFGSGCTLHSIGIGTSDAENDRANAFEVMQDGKVYILNVGDYNGKNSTTTGILDVATVITGIQNNIGNISSVLDSINGEVL